MTAGGVGPRMLGLEGGLVIPDGAVWLVVLVRFEIICIFFLRAASRVRMLVTTDPSSANRQVRWRTIGNTLKNYLPILDLYTAPHTFLCIGTFRALLYL